MTVTADTHMGVVEAALDSWDPKVEGWTNRRVARKFADHFIKDGLSPKAVQLDKDGGIVRLYFPALGGMWRPVGTDPLAWLEEYHRVVEQFQRGEE